MEANTVSDANIYFNFVFLNLQFAHTPLKDLATPPMPIVRMMLRDSSFTGFPWPTQTTTSALPNREKSDSSPPSSKAEETARARPAGRQWECWSTGPGCGNPVGLSCLPGRAGRASSRPPARAAHPRPAPAASTPARPLPGSGLPPLWAEMAWRLPAPTLCPPKSLGGRGLRPLVTRQQNISRS